MFRAGSIIGICSTSVITGVKRSADTPEAGAHPMKGSSTTIQYSSITIICSWRRLAILLIFPIELFIWKIIIHASTRCAHEVCRRRKHKSPPVDENGKWRSFTIDFLHDGESNRIEARKCRFSLITSRCNIQLCFLHGSSSLFNVKNAFISRVTIFSGNIIYWKHPPRFPAHSNLHRIRMQIKRPCSPFMDNRN